MLSIPHLLIKRVGRLFLSIKKRLRSNAQVFQDHYNENSWGDSESVSGPGSNLHATQHLRNHLPPLLHKYNIQSILDLPCGDHNWMKELDYPFKSYIGADIVPNLIQQNTQKYKTLSKTFQLLDATQDPLPPADLLLCRDMLVHLSNTSIKAVLNNIKSSKIQYVLFTHFTEETNNKAIRTGSWRPLNLCLPPFNFPQPIEILFENSPELDGLYKNSKSLALWKVSDIPS